MPNKPSIVISGYLSKDAEMRYTQNGVAVLSFTMPFNNWASKQLDGYEKAYSGNGFTATSWQNFVCFGDLAENNAKLSKGDFVKVEVSYNGKAEKGTMRPRTYNDKTSYDYVVRAFLSMGDNQPDYEDVEPADYEPDNEIPF